MERPSLAAPAQDVAPAPSLIRRRLVTVRRISAIEKAPKTGFSCIHVDGWTVLMFVRRGEYKVGDLVVFFEIDSLLPKTSLFWEYFLADPDSVVVHEGVERFRVRSCVVSKWTSQGVITRLEYLPKILHPYQERIEEIGEEAATEELLLKSFEDVINVKKYEHPSVNLEAQPIIGSAPAFVMQPGWSRIQNIEHTIFSPEVRLRKWQVSEKLDGVTMHVYKVAKDSRWHKFLPALPGGYPQTMSGSESHVGVCGRRHDYMDNGTSLYWEVAKESTVVDKIRSITYPNIVVQGELVGSSIEGNTRKYPEGHHEFVVFGIWNIDTAQYVNVREVEDICEWLEIKHVDVYGHVKVTAVGDSMQALLRMAEGTNKNGGVREGFVFKSMDARSCFKVISNEWLKITGK
ncbi:RNA ligase-domain-containing protein [Lasiosphaeris hirsuta]|uniref:RNA ligase-domain-containing protein n=1 Tax=Lasiosphaeris hirsuta TaxID=260670 RepID=A0AA40ED67_9PEZI|nr:RNA ligase-domain-containing protein [Lasiosphaeris hirsuta]